MNLNRQRLEYAAEGFLASMRRSWVKKNPGEVCPIKPTLGEYSESDRSALLAAAQTVIMRVDGEADKSFAAWSARRHEAAT